MKIKNLPITLGLFIAFASVYGGGSREPELVNTQQIRLGTVKSIDVAYASGSITIFHGTSEYLELREYMNDAHDRYYADITEAGDRVSIKSGKRPFLTFGTFRSYVEIYLPASYRGDFSVKTASGNLESSDSFSFRDAEFSSSSGRLFFSNIHAQTAAFKSSSGHIVVDRIFADSSSFTASSGAVTIGNLTGSTEIQVSSGSVAIGRAAGEVNIRVSSGGITVGELRGAVNARTSSGGVKCSVTDLSGDITLVTTSGSIALALPRSSGFAFSAKTGSGRISVPFADNLTGTVKNLSGTVGNSDKMHVSLDTSSGNIEVTW